MTTVSKQVFRCRGCGAFLDLEDTQHGSHVIYEQAGPRECGPVDAVKKDILRPQHGHTVRISSGGER